MAASLKDIVSMFDSEKHQASADKTFSAKSDGFADDAQREINKISSEECNEFADEMLRDLLD